MTSRSKFQDRIVAALSYSFVLPAFVILLLRPYRSNAFVRFHAAQSVLVSAAELAFALIAYALLNVSAILGIILGSVLAIGSTILWALLVIKAFQGEWFALPWLGNWAYSRVEPSVEPRSVNAA